MESFNPQEPLEQPRNIGEAHPAEKDTPRWFAYIAVAITLASMVIGLALVAGGIYWLYRRF